MRPRFAPLAFAPLAFAPWALGSCGADGASDSGVGDVRGSGGASSGSAGAEATCVSEVGTDGGLVLRARPVNNYAFQSDLVVAVTTVAANSELFIDWSGLTEDFVHHPVDPLLGIDTVGLFVWDISLEDFTAKLNADDLGASDVEAVAVFDTENAVTSASVFDFVVAGGGELPRDELMARLDPELFAPEQFSYTLMAMQGQVLGQGVEMVQAFRLDSASTNQSITVSPASTSITFTADLSNLMPVRVPTGQANITVDWSGMTTNAMGREWTIRSIEEVMVGYFEETPAELEAEFLDLELIAEDLWRGSVEAGDSLSLTALSNEAAQPFPGIAASATGTWLLVLVCGDCGNPAPWYLTQLVPCAAQPGT